MRVSNFVNFSQKNSETFRKSLHLFDLSSIMKRIRGDVCSFLERFLMRLNMKTKGIYSYGKADLRTLSDGLFVRDHLRQLFECVHLQASEKREHCHDRLALHELWTQIEVV